eukprot:2554310-Rhodomonas_salina.1
MTTRDWECVGGTGEAGCEGGRAHPVTNRRTPGVVVSTPHHQDQHAGLWPRNNDDTEGWNIRLRVGRADAWDSER